MSQLPVHLDRDSIQFRLRNLDAETSDRVGWIIEQIADEGYAVGPLEMPWVGRTAIVERTLMQFSLQRPVAEELVNLAHADLWLGGSATASHAERRLLTSRLNIIRRVILQAVKAPRKTTTFVFKKTKGEDGKPTLLRVPKRETIREGYDANAIRLLLDVERMIVAINSLDEPQGDTELVAAIFKQLEQDEDGKTVEKITTSISQKVKNMDLSRLSPAGREVVEQAVKQEKHRRKAKLVKSAVMEGNHERATEESGVGAQAPEAHAVRPVPGGPDAAPELEVQD